MDKPVNEYAYHSLTPPTLILAHTLFYTHVLARTHAHTHPQTELPPTVGGSLP